MRTAKTRQQAGLGLALLASAFLAGQMVYAVSAAFGYATTFTLVFLGLYFCGSAIYRLTRRHDPYSLEALREIEEQSKDQPEEMDLSEKGGQLCHTCGEVYGPQYNACPRCGRSF